MELGLYMTLGSDPQSNMGTLSLLTLREGNILKRPDIIFLKVISPSINQGQQRSAGILSRETHEELLTPVAMNI